MQNSKSQVPNSKETSSSKPQNGVQRFGAWMLELLWSLELVTWNFFPYASVVQKKSIYRCNRNFIFSRKPLAEVAL